MPSKSARYLFAIVQVIIGLNWLLTGLNKFFYGKFPQSLGTALQTGAGVAPVLGHNPNAWYDAFVQAVVLPNSVLFGYLVEWGEVTIGIVYLLSALLLLGWPLKKGNISPLMARIQLVFNILAISGATSMGLNFNFWRGRAFPLFDPKNAYLPVWEANLILPMFSLCTLIFSLWVWREVTRTRRATDSQRGQVIQEGDKGYIDEVMA